MKKEWLKTVALVLIIFLPKMANAEEYRNPCILIPKCSRPPAIDGRIEDSEWAQAAAVTGFMKSLMTERQPVAWITYDDEKMYFAVRSPIPEGMKLKHLTRNRDANYLWRDDTIELWINPVYPEQERQYQFMGNSAGAILDFECRPLIGLELATWNGNWQFENSRIRDYWDAEIAIRFQDIGLKTPEPGDAIGLDFCRNWVNPELIFTDWVGGGFGRKWAKGVFGGDSTFVRVLDIRGLLENKASAVIKVIGGPEPAEVSVRIEIRDKKTGESIYQENKEEKLAPREEKTVVFDHKLDRDGEKVCLLEVTDKDGDEVYYSHQINFKEGTRDKINTEQQRLFEVRAGFYPSFNAIRPEVDIMDFEQGPEVKQIEVTINKENDKKIIAGCKIDKFDKGYGYAERFALPELAEGKYEVRFCSRNTKGENLGVEQALFEKKPDYPWFKEKAGISDEVLPPFTALEMKGNKIECWGREYVFSESGWPSDIITKEKQILTAPIRLAGVIDKKNIDWQQGNWKVMEKKSNIIRMQALNQGDGLQVKMDIDVEYDGMMKFRMNLYPLRKLRIEKLALEIPLEDEHAFYYHVVRDWARVNSETGILPKGQGKIWGSGKVKNITVLGSFVPYIWLGDDQRGFCWFADNDKGWITSDEKDSLELFREGNTLKLIINFVSRQAEIGGPRAIVFGLQATPAKPLPRGWRKINSTVLEDYPVRNIFSSLSEGLEFQGFGRPKNEQKLKKQIDWFHSLGARARTALSPNDFWGETEENIYFENEWTPGCSLVLRNDFVLWHFERIVRDYGLDGAYVDDTFPVACRNTITGCGYVREDGKIQAGYNLFGERDFFKRLATILHKYRKDGLIWIHMTDTMLIPCFSFGDVAMDGEMSGRYQWPLEVIRIRMGKQWGLIPSSMFLNQPGNKTYRLLHDLVSSHPGWDEKDIDPAKKEFGIGDGNVEFFGYWENGGYVRSDVEAVKISFWKKPGRLLLVAGNTGKETEKVRIRFDQTNLGLGGNIKLIDAISKEELKMVRAEISLDIGGYGFRLIHIISDN